MTTGDQDVAKNVRWRPRISLLTILLLMTITGMAIVIAQMWREVGPLRAENRQLRTELGFLNVDDLDKPCAIQVPTGESNHWKWRIYLPPGRQYRVLCYSGMLPSPTEFPGSQWYTRVETGGVGSGSASSIESGEFTLEAKLEQEDGQWMFTTIQGGGKGWGKQSVSHNTDDWLSQPEGSSVSSGVSTSQQLEFDPDEPIMLLKVQKPDIKRRPTGYSKSEPTGAAEGLVLWIAAPRTAKQVRAP